MIRRLLFYLWIELPLYVLLAILHQLRESPVAQELGALVTHALVSILTRVLDDEAVQAHLAQGIAAGLNCFLSKGDDLELHVRSMAACVSKTQPDLARRQGQDFPLIVGSFLQGILHGVSQHKSAPQESDTTAGNTPPPPTSSDAVEPEPRAAVLDTSALPAAPKRFPFLTFGTAKDTAANAANEGNSNDLQTTALIAAASFDSLDDAAYSVEKKVA